MKLKPERIETDEQHRGTELRCFAPRWIGGPTTM